MSPTETDRPPRDAYARHVAIPTRWGDNDVYGHVNNAVYYTYLDTAVNALLIEAGVLDPLGSATIGLVVETGCRYFAPVSYPETVTAGVRVAHLGRSSVRYEIGLFREHEAAPCAQGHFVHVTVDRASRRPVPLPAALRRVLEGWGRP